MSVRTVHAAPATVGAAPTTNRLAHVLTAGFARLDIGVRPGKEKETIEQAKERVLAQERARRAAIAKEAADQKRKRSREAKVRARVAREREAREAREAEEEARRETSRGAAETAEEQFDRQEVAESNEEALFKKRVRLFRRQLTRVYIAKRLFEKGYLNADGQRVFLMEEVKRKNDEGNFERKVVKKDLAGILADLDTEYDPETGQFAPTPMNESKRAVASARDELVRIKFGLPTNPDWDEQLDDEEGEEER